MFDDDDDDEDGLPGWLIFVLIFGAGNILLYYTSGYILIPLK